MKKQAIPPCDLKAEQAVLGSMILEKGAIQEVVGGDTMLDAEDFSAEGHKIIFSAMCAMFEEGDNTDKSTLLSRLRHHADADKWGGEGYIADLMEAVATTANIGQYARTVREYRVRRDLWTLAYGMVRQDLSVPVEALVERTRQGIGEAMLHLDGNEGGFVDLKAVIKEETDEMASRKETKEIAGVPTGISWLDRFTGGLEPAQLWVICGDPSRGKSALLIQILAHMALLGNAPAALFSLEMPGREVWRRMLATKTGIGLLELRQPLVEWQWKEVSKAGEESYAAPLYIYDSGAVSVQRIARHAREAVDRWGVKAIGVDYLQLLPGKAELRMRATENIRALKAIAREVKVPVVVVSSLARPADQQENPRPTMGRLKESGDIEYAADVVVGVWHKKWPQVSGKQFEDAMLYLLKQRNGPTGCRDFTWDKIRQRFAETDKQTEEEVVPWQQK